MSVILVLRACSAVVFGLAWVFISLRDIKERKVLNRTLLLGAAFAACGYALLAADTALATAGVVSRAHPFYVWGFFRASLLHALMCFGAALALWAFGIWPAGDAKLFALLAVLFPLLDGNNLLFPSHLFLAFLLNIFVPAACVVTLQVLRHLWQTRLRHRLSSLRAMGPRIAAAYLWRSLRERAGALRAEPGALLGRALSFAAFTALGSSMQLALQPVYQSVRGLPPFLWLGLYFGMRWARSLVSSRAVTLCSLAVAAFGLWCRPALDFRSFASLFLRWSLVWMLLSRLVRLVGEQLDSQEIRECGVAELKPYMVLAPSTWDKIRADDEFYQEHFSMRYADGLSPGQTEALRDWCERNSVATLQYQNTMAFSFWIFAGIFLTWTLQRDVLSALRSLWTFLLGGGS